MIVQFEAEIADLSSISACELAPLTVAGDMINLVESSLTAKPFDIVIMAMIEMLTNKLANEKGTTSNEIKS